MTEGLRRFLTLGAIFALAFMSVLLYRYKVEGGSIGGLWLFKNKEEVVYEKESYTLPEKTELNLEEVSIINRLDEEFTTLVNYVLPSVVSIDTVEDKTQNRINWNGHIWRKRYKTTAVGSGVIVSSEGHVVTNAHVVADKREIGIRMYNGERYPAVVIGIDRPYDIAVLRIKREGEFQPLPFGDSREVLVGQTVFAIGSPFRLRETVTKGIISAKGRSFSDQEQDLFQTDAAVNPGSSGGPLINLKGEIVGINKSIIGSNREYLGFQGAGFSIPANDAKESFEEIMKKGRPVKGFLGVKVDDIPKSRFARSMYGYYGNKGAIVKKVLANSPASDAGFLEDDVILKFGEVEINSKEHLLTNIRRSRVGDNVKVVLWRYGNNIEKRVVIADPDKWERPPMDPVLKKKHWEDNEIRKEIGIKVREMLAEEVMKYGKGVVVTRIEKGSLASDTKLKVGDYILTINGEVCNSKKLFYETIIASAPVEDTQFMIRRGSRSQGLVVIPRLR